MSKQLKEAKVENLPIQNEFCIRGNRRNIREGDKKDHFYCLKGLKGESSCTVSSLFIYL